MAGLEVLAQIFMSSRFSCLLKGNALLISFFYSIAERVTLKKVWGHPVTLVYLLSVGASVASTLLELQKRWWTSGRSMVCPELPVGASWSSTEMWGAAKSLHVCLQQCLTVQFKCLPSQSLVNMFNSRKALTPSRYVIHIFERKTFNPCNL